jgi:phosphate transport system substrate-binding protein
MRQRGRPLAVAGFTVLAVLGAACSSSNNNSSSGNGSSAPAFEGAPLTGAGSTFAEPVYDQWGKDFNGIESGAQINYQGIGSGGGVDAFTKQTVEFGASDAPLQPSQSSDLPGTAIEIPTMLGGVAVAYNLPGVDSGLKLDAQTIADIFLRKVTTWNDPEIASLNAGVNLPSTPIKPVHRSDDSGTTFVYTTWLSDGSPTWKKQIGANTTVQWPAGEAGKDGSDGVAAYMKQTEGSIGYIAYDYVVANGLGAAAVKAPDGSFVAPSPDSISAAGQGLKLPIKPNTNVLNSSTSGAYPIATTTYALIYKDQTDQDKAQTLVDYFTYGLTTGQGLLTQLNYAPLPDAIRQQALQALGEVTVNGQPVQPSAGVGG